jgi:hypothetical protein
LMGDAVAPADLDDGVAAVAFEDELLVTDGEHVRLLWLHVPEHPTPPDVSGARRSSYGRSAPR